jgi:thiamine biosynthesis lipoprotein
LRRAVCRKAHPAADASGGRFDPTVEALRSSGLRKRHVASSKQTVSAHVGRQMVQQDSAMIALKPGMAPTLNGIGQRHAVDRFAGFLEAEVLTDILIDIR